MKQPKIQAHKITKPFQLMAVWFVGLIFVVGIFFYAAAVITTPGWITPVLVISGVLFVPSFIFAVFRMQTKYRNELQEDHYYFEYKKWHESLFKDFSPENILGANQSRQNNVCDDSRQLSVGDDLETLRCGKYEQQKGLFLIHSWRPSSIDGQVADIVIWLHQHRTGPLSDGLVDRVEYQLGPMFFDGPAIKRNHREAFKLEVSAYGPMLCTAKVYFKDESAPIVLERYIDFEDTPI